MNKNNHKIAAIYDLREAAERKGRIEKALDDEPTPQKRDELLEAQLRLEQKTVTAIDACETCHLPHAPDEPHRSNVVHVDFVDGERA